MNQELSEKYNVLKAKLRVKDEEVAEWFGLKNAATFRASSSRERIVKGIVALYEKATGEVL